MSDTDQEPKADEASEGMKNLRAKADKADAAEARASQLERELAFTKAGINTDSKPAQALLQGYTGELTAEAIQAEAKEWNLYQEQGAAPAPDYSADRAAQEMRDSVNTGAPAVDEPREKPANERVFEEFVSERESGYSQQDATNRAIGKFIQAGAAGDPSVLFNEDKWADRQMEAGHGAQFAK